LVNDFAAKTNGALIPVNRPRDTLDPVLRPAAAVGRKSLSQKNQKKAQALGLGLIHQRRRVEETNLA
jgi:hypothetical protein